MGKQCASGNKANQDGKKSSAKKNKKGTKNYKQGANDIMSEMNHQESLFTGQNDNSVKKGPYKFMNNENDENDNITDINEYFLKQLFKNGVPDYINPDGSMTLSYELLMTISKAQMALVERLLQTLQTDEFVNQVNT